jgi:hypothetical protein
MEFQSAKQISPENLQSTEYDIFILAAGYEQRSIFLPLNYSINAKLKIALAFEEKPKELNRKSNDIYLIEKGFKLITLSGDEILDPEKYFSDFFKEKSIEHLNILVDYSSMTKVWYANILNYLIGSTKGPNNVTVHFSYTPALYNELKKSGPVKYNTPISHSYKKDLPSSKQIALIIGLGLNNSSAEFIRKSLNPTLTVLFYADPTNDLKYVKKVLKCNQELVEQTEVRNLINFPLNELDKTNEILTNLCLGLRVNYNVVIAPVGPKVFSFLALLLASKYPDITVLRLSSGANATAYDRMPSSEPLIYSVEFVNEEIDY